MPYIVQVANEAHFHFAETICEMMADAAKIRGTGIAKRDPQYIKTKMAEGKAVIALCNNTAVGFCYIESWEGKKYVANSGLIVHPDYRKTQLARTIKRKVFELSKNKFPNAMLFGITTSPAVMKINSELGYKPVTFSELTQDKDFWKGCENCTNHDILLRTNRNMCLCTGMAFDLSKAAPKVESKTKSWEKFNAFLAQRKQRIKQKLNKFPFLKPALKNLKHNEK